MSLEAIADAFGDKNSQKLSLKVALRDVLEKEIPISSDTNLLFKDILLFFERNDQYQAQRSEQDEKNLNSNNKNVR